MMAVSKFKLKIIPSVEAKVVASDLLAGKPVNQELLAKANENMGLKIDIIEADAETLHRVVKLLEKELGAPPQEQTKT